MANTSNISSLQSGDWGERYSTPPRLSRNAAQQDVEMDEEQAAPGAPRKTQRKQGASNNLLPERLQSKFDRAYDDTIERIDAFLEQYGDSCFESLSRLIRAAVHLGGAHALMSTEDLLEEIEEGDPIGDEDEN